MTWVRFFFPLLPHSFILHPSLFTELCVWSQEAFYFHQCPPQLSVRCNSWLSSGLNCVYLAVVFLLTLCVWKKEKKKQIGRSSVWYAHLISPIKSSGSSSQGKKKKKSWLLFNSFTASLYKPFNSAVLLCWFLLGSAGRELSFALPRGTQQQLLVLWSLN